MSEGYHARRWHEAVKAKLDAGYNREKAILMVEKQNPELRAKFLAELNGRDIIQSSHRR